MSITKYSAVLLCFMLILVDLFGQKRKDWTQTSQNDWMNGITSNINRRLLDATNTPLDYDKHPDGSFTLSSRPGSFVNYSSDLPLLNKATIPSIVKIDDSYVMIYLYQEDLHYARSKGGFRWKKKGKLNIPNDGYEADPYLLFDGDKYRLWYGSIQWDSTFNILYTESKDLLNWTDPVVALAGQMESKQRYIGIHSIAFLGKNRGWDMVYTADDGSDNSWQLFYSESNDGIHWEVDKDNRINIVKQAGIIFSPSFLYNGDNFLLTYGVRDLRSKIVWSISDSIPLFSESGIEVITNSNKWDIDTEICCGQLLLVGDEYRYYYTAWDEAIGLSIAQAKYESQGTFISEILNTSGAYWDQLVIDADIPDECEVKAYTRSSPDKIHWSGWRPIIENGRIASSPDRYLMYKIELFTSDTSKSPKVNEVKVEWY